MEIQTVSESCVALLLHRLLTEDEPCAALVRSALDLAGIPRWERMELEVFPAEGETLILARPAPELFVEIADYALPFLQGERGEGRNLEFS